MVEINWTDQAKYWLRHIHDYLEGERSGLGKSVVSKIVERTTLLEKWPTSGFLYPAFEQEDVRVIFYLRYRIAYMVICQDRIDIIGVFHGRMTIEKHLHDHI